MSNKKGDVMGAKRLMGALLRMPPKPHSEMKIKKIPRGSKPNKSASKKDNKRKTNGD